MNDSMQSTSSMLRALAPLALLIAGASGCAVQSDDAPEQVGEAQGALAGGFVAMPPFGSMTDELGPVVTSGRSCFLSGVFGNLSQGEEWYGGSRESEAGLRGGRLRAHGGAFDSGDNNDLPNWANNYVGARAVCVSEWDAAHVATGMLDVAAGNPSVLTTSATFIVGPDAGGNRQCWLTNLSGVQMTWADAGSFAKVKFHATTDAQHTKVGWYIDARLNTSNFGHGHVVADCWDFPFADDWGTHAVSSSAGSFGTTTWTALSNSACGLTEVTGAFIDNWGENGAYLVPPASPLGTSWSLKAYGGKTAKAVCVH